MMNGFGRNKVLGRGTDRDKLMLIATVGLAVSLLIITVLVLNFRTSASATQDRSADVASVAPAAIGTVSLIAPERVVRAGTPLKDVRLKEVFWPRNQVPEGAVRDAAELSNHFAKIDLDANIPIRKSDITNEPMMVSLPLTPGMRAISIEVDATSGLEGHALPGTRVDVVLTFQEEGKLNSKIIVQNARVLSYGGDVTPGSRRSPVEKVSPSVSRTMTLEVSTEDALRIQTGRQMGRISLIMRSADDVTTAPVTDMGQNEVGNNSESRPVRDGGCTRGKMKMGGRDYIIDCDGRISEVLNSREP
jgi:pilus assembly protein CpaB